MQNIIKNNNKENDSLDYFGEYDVNYKLSPEVIAEINKAIVFLKLANIYTHRIDYLLSGDDGEESFFKRIEEDLNKYKDENNNCD
jgi:hypothetical protein